MGDSRSKLDRDSDLSLTLDAVRAFAAQVVCVGHAVSFARVGPLLPPNLPHFQNLAVVVFFLLSGYVIGASLWRRSRQSGYEFRHFAVARFARIYSAWVPALILVAAIDGVLIAANLHETPENASVRIWLGNLVQLQMYGGPLEFLAVNSFGSGGPFWTLAAEFHIYMFVGAVFFAIYRRSLLLCLVAIAFCVVPVRYLLGDIQQGVGTGLFSVWLAGFALSLIVDRGLFDPPRWIGAALLAAGLAVVAARIRPGHEYAWDVYAPLIVSFAGMIGLASRSNGVLHGSRAAPFIRIAADYSFTLYLVHYTVLYALFRTFPGTPLLNIAIGVIGSNVLAYAIAQRFEMRHRRFSSWLMRRLSIRAPMQPRQAPVAWGQMTNPQK